MVALVRAGIARLATVPIASALAVGTGGPGLLGVRTVIPTAADEWYWWAVWWVSLAVVAGLFVGGLVGLLAWAVRRGFVSWSFLRRLRIDVYMADETRPRDLADVTPKESLAAAKPGELTGRVRTALDAALTWLYRRAEWPGLSDDQRYRDPAPDSWARDKYTELGVGGMDYSPPQTVAAEKGFKPNAHASPTSVRLWADPEPVTNIDRLALAAQLAMETASEDPPPRPPKALGLPDYVWEHQREEWCATRAEVMRRGQELLTALHRVPVHAGPNDATEFHEPVRRWLIDEFNGRIVIPYWGSEEQSRVEAEAMADPSRFVALDPPWRRDHVQKIAGRMDWLRRQPHDCPMG